MSASIVRVLVGWVLVFVIPTSLLGQTSGAILHAQGGVWVNGYEAKDSSAVFDGDLLETKLGFAATLSLEGTSIVIQQESLAKFQGDLLILEHGGVSVETSRSFKVRVNCITVVPIVNERTLYEVTDVNRTVHVAARKLDVNVQHEMKAQKPAAQSSASESGSVHEGEEKSYDESAVCGPPPEMAHPGKGVDPKWIGAGAGGAGLLLCLLVCIGHGGGTKPSMSASAP